MYKATRHVAYIRASTRLKEILKPVSENKNPMKFRFGQISIHLCCEIVHNVGFDVWYLLSQQTSVQFDCLNIFKTSKNAEILCKILSLC